MSILGMGIAVVAAAFIGLGFVAQQHAAFREPLEEILHPRLLLDLVRSRLWLTGIASMIVGQIIFAFALNISDVSEVTPVLTVNLVFALFAAHVIYRERLGRNEWLGALLLTAGVALFLGIGVPHGGALPGVHSVRWLAGAGVLALVALCAFGGLHRDLRVRAMLLACGAGLLYGLQDTLTRSVLLISDDGFARIFVNWQPYGVVFIGALGLLFAQSAFDAAPLRISLPATTAAEPLTGIALSIVIFGERVRLEVSDLALEAVGLAAMVGGIIVLGRSPYLGKPGDHPAAAPPDGVEYQ
ncbi:EamA-like transporter family protein [Actinomadura meyerae]|jgi:drug/metabolite transporter (DMT)-like permease|uniref:EamA-like transporter family protein n=1 Tax=Actinomadura meyerae TaxID=240840 RepID=A0A239FNM6_9ACTN|nr:DMT family transporter [Actinomadura meyerae]SNS58228.1 EamA-like transporter family protein [Actinomadura meyerae]